MKILHYFSCNFKKLEQQMRNISSPSNKIMKKRSKSENNQILAELFLFVADSKIDDWRSLLGTIPVAILIKGASK